MKRVLNDLRSQRSVFAGMLEKDKAARAEGRSYTHALGPVLGGHMRDNLERHIEEIDAVLAKAES